MKNKLIYLLLLFSLVIIFGCKATSNPAPISKYTFNNNSTKLATIKTGTTIEDAFFSNDGHSVAIIIQDGSKKRMQINDSLSAPNDDIRNPAFFNNQIAYIVKDGPLESVVANNTNGKSFDAVTKPKFTPDGVVLYAGRQKDHWVIVRGDETSQPFYSADPSIFLNAVGQIAYQATDTTTKKSFLTVLDKNLKPVWKGKKYDFIAQPIVANASKSNLLYIAGLNGKQHVVNFTFNNSTLKETEGITYDSITNLAISQDGLTAAYLIAKGNKLILVIGKNEHAMPPLDMALDVECFDADNALFSAVKGNNVLLFVNGKESGKQFNGINFMIYSNDGKHYAIAAEVAGKDKIFLNDKIVGEYDKIVSPQFSKDNTLLVYRARSNDKRFVVVYNMKTGASKELTKFDAVWNPVFSPDGKSIGYGVRKGNEFWWQVDKLN
ncbi:MAG: hypothetical protein FWD78_17615 [Treponema sp.]|nr:hypothetical protein [Treponema sp.]